VKQEEKEKRSFKKNAYVRLPKFEEGREIGEVDKTSTQKRGGGGGKPNLLGDEGCVVLKRGEHYDPERVKYLTHHLFWGGGP